MTDPRYRQRLQRIADLLLAVIPASWHEAGLRATFPDEIGTDFETWYREAPGARESPADIPMPIARDLAKAARALRAELVRAGNPECRGLVFRISSAGKSSLDVEY